MTKTLIRDATVLTMDPAAGTLTPGDVLLDGSRIGAVGRSLPADGAEIVDATGMICMPGLVDTHRHLWGSILRGSCCNGDLGSYYAQVVFTHGAAFTPSDTYASAMLGLAEAIDAGITTVHAWEHNLQTRDHARAVVQALRDSGVRGRFSYGSSNDPEDGSSFAKGTETIDLEHVAKIASELAAPDGLLGLGLACRGAEHSRPEVWQAEYAWARNRSLPFSTHTMNARADVERVRAVTAYAERGFLGSDHLLIHAIHVSGAEIAELARTGTPVSVSILSELRTGMGIPPIVDMLAAGVNVVLSTDTNAAADTCDLFAAMRTTVGVERGLRQDPTVYGPERALAQATIDGARALGLDATTGSLAPGKRADVILVRADELNIAPLNQPDAQLVFAAQPRNVDSVWIDGAPLKRNGTLTTLRESAIVAEAVAAAARVAARSGVPIA